MFCVIYLECGANENWEIMKETEATLIHQVRKGRRECFRPLVEKYERKVFLLACSLLGNGTDAQDAAQDAFFLAFQKLGELRETGKFGPWLFGITRNLCFEMLRKRREAPTALDDVPAQDLKNVIAMRPSEEEGESLVDVMLRRLDDLPEKYRVLLRLKYLEDYSYQEIAEMTDIPVDLVRSRLYEGRRMLREGVEQARGQDGYGG